MLSLSQFRTHLFPLFKIQHDTGMVLHVVYKGVTYQVDVRRTDIVPKLTHAKTARGAILPNKIDTTECDTCGSLQFNGVCMNRECPTVKTENR